MRTEPAEALAVALAHDDRAPAQRQWAATSAADGHEDLDRPDLAARDLSLTGRLVQTERMAEVVLGHGAGRVDLVAKDLKVSGAARRDGRTRNGVCARSSIDSSESSSACAVLARLAIPGLLRSAKRPSCDAQVRSDSTHLRLGEPLMVLRVDDEDDARDLRVVILPQTTRLLMSAELQRSDRLNALLVRTSYVVNLTCACQSGLSRLGSRTFPIASSSDAEPGQTRPQARLTHWDAESAAALRGGRS